jgi:F-box-like
MLPDEVLLGIFEFCADEDRDTKEEIEAWQSLVHVCRRWRSIVFGSPRRLNLQLVCTPKTSARVIDVWPPLSLVIQGRLTEGVDNIIGVLERRDRVGRIELFDVDGSPSESVLEAMQEPFPELTHLVMSSLGTLTVLPDSFLGGYAPHLRVLWLDAIPFPGLPKLLLPAIHLVDLRVWNIPHSGYISPSAMVTALSSLTSLELLSLKFQSPRYHPDVASRRLPPPTRSVLPLLTRFLFEGVCEYLEDLMARIDAPRVNDLSITFFNDIEFDTPQLTKFISRSTTLNPLKTTRVVFMDGAAMVRFSSQTSGYGLLEVKISCRELDWQVSSLEQVCTSCLPALSTSENLYICKAQYSRPDWQDNIENTLWLELLHPFTAVKHLYLCEEFAPRIVPVLQELVGDRTTEVLPALRKIFLEEPWSSDPVQEGIGKIVAARQVSGYNIGVYDWGRG